MERGVDKKALLDELRIDRTAAEPSGRPLKWFVLIAVVGGNKLTSRWEAEKPGEKANPTNHGNEHEPF